MCKLPILEVLMYPHTIREAGFWNVHWQQAGWFGSSLVQKLWHPWFVIKYFTFQWPEHFSTSWVYEIIALMLLTLHKIPPISEWGLYLIRYVKMFFVWCTLCSPVASWSLRMCTSQVHQKDMNSSVFNDSLLSVTCRGFLHRPSHLLLSGCIPDGLLHRCHGSVLQRKGEF